MINNTQPVIFIPPKPFHKGHYNILFACFYLLLSLFFLFPINAFAQSEAGTPASSRPAQTIDEVYLDARNLYREELFNKSLEKLLEGFESLKTRDTTYYKYVLLIGRNYTKLAYYQRALEYYTEYLTWAEANNSAKDIAKVSSYLSATHQALGSFDKSYEYGLRSLRINEDLKDPSGIAQALYELGTLFFYQKSYQEALSYYKQSMNVCEATGQSRELSACISAIGSVYEDLNDLESALSYSLRALELAQNLKDKTLESYALHNIGTVYLKKEMHEVAANYLNASLKLKEELKDLWGIVASRKYLGQLNMAQGNYAGAIQQLNIGLKITRDNNSKNRETEILYILSEAYQKAGNYEQAMLTLRRSADLKDSILNEAIVKELGEKKESYEILKKERQIAVLTKQQEIDKLSTYIVSIIAASLLVLGGLIFRQYSLQRRNNKVLQGKNEQIDGQNKLLKQVNEELEQFAHVASHDLREPLRTIGSFSTLLNRHYEDQLDDTAREYQGFIQSAVKRMQRLLDDLLDYARIDRKEGERETTDLKRLLQEVLLNLKNQVESSQAVVEISALPSIKVFPRQMVQLFQNLISNGIKYRGTEAPHIRISSTFSAQTNTHIFAIADNGIGMSPSGLERIFDMFVRLHGQEEYEGSGIGLATCKKIVERHGGEIWAESTPGQGSTFYFSIPAN